MKWKEWLAKCKRGPLVLTGLSLVALVAVSATLFWILRNKSPFDDTSSPAPGLTAQPSNAGVSPDVRFAMEPERSKGESVDLDSGFWLRAYSDVPVTARQVEASLRTVPPLDMEISQTEDNTFLLKPKRQMARNTVYTLSVSDPEGGAFSWAFQTERNFSVISAMPADGSRGVPLDTGVELQFSAYFNDAASFFTIDPPVDGRFEIHDKTLVFVPQKPLTPFTVYRVSISEGCRDVDGNPLAETYTAAFRTTEYDEDETVYYPADAFFESVLPDDPVVMELCSTQPLADVAFTTELYRLRDYEQYWALIDENDEHISPTVGNAADYTADVSQLPKVSEFTAKPEGDSTGYLSDRFYIILPETPPEGYYLLDTFPAGRPDGKHVQKLIQVSRLSVYCESVGGQAVVWVNNAATGAAEADAPVEITTDGHKASGRTDTQGVAQITLPPADKPSRLLVRTSSGLLFAAKLMFSEPFSPSSAQSYRSVVYLDRAAYLPNDTIRYWGILRPKYQGVSLPARLTLTMGIGEYPGYETTVSVDANGVFEGEIPLVSQRSGHCALQFKDGGETLIYTYCNILEYTKPSYVLDVATDQPYYKPGQPVILTVRASFFDGTPAAGLSAEADGSFATQAFTLDNQGTATVTIWPPEQRHPYPYSFYITVRITGAEDILVWTTAAPYVFPTTAYVWLEPANTNEAYQFSLKARSFDFAKVDAYFAEDGQREPVDFEAFLGGPADIAGEYQVTERQYLKTPSGSYYDFIHKKEIPQYTYDEAVKTHPAVPFTIQNGVFGTGPLPYPAADNATQYDLDIYFVDEQGSRYTFTQTLAGRYPYGYPRASFYYVAQIDQSGMPADSYQGIKLYETVRFSLKNQADDILTGRRLFTVFKDKYISVSAGTDDLAMTFTPEMVAVSFVSGAYFDGRHVYAAQHYTARYDTSEKSLSLSVTASQETYKPGGEANLSLTLTTPDGEPVCAPFVLSVVDEAAFAVMDQYTDPLAALYEESFWPQNFRTYASYVDHDPRNFFGGAEGGGEGGGAYLRSNFQDTAAFMTGYTDASGQASLTFTLPDNLTSWRVTAMAISGDARVGFCKTKLVTTVPAFTQLVLNEKYTAGDDVSFSARMFGAHINPEDIVDYSVNVEGGQPLKQKLTAAAGAFSTFSLGKLPKGAYTLTITAKTDRQADAVKRTFQVLDSPLEVPVAVNMELPALTQIEAKRFPVRVSIFDRKMERYFAVLGKLTSAYGARTEAVLGRTLAFDRFYAFYHAEESKTGKSAGLLSLYDGGLSINAYSESSAVLSAKALVTCPDYVNQADIRRYLYNVLCSKNAETEAVCAAYMGLAGLREPVLADIKHLLAREASLSLRDCLYLATGLALLGDAETAKDWYAEHISPLLRREANALSVRADSPAQAYALTAESAFLSLLLANDDADGLYEYLLANRSDEYLPNLELCGYVTYASSPADSGGSFRFIRNGQTVTENLAGKWCVSLELTQEQLKNADFQVLSGDLAANVSYTGGVGCLPYTDNKAIDVKKSYAFADGDGLGALVRVTLEVSLNLPEEGGEVFYDGLTLTDVLPGNLRYASCPYRYDEHWYLTSREAQTLTFHLQHIFPQYDRDRPPTPQVCKQFTVVYYARLVLPGEYVTESAVVTQDLTGLSGVSERGAWGKP